VLLFQNKRGQGEELADWQMDALRSIDQATLRLSELIDDLLNVTRLQSVRLKLYPQPTSLTSLIPLCDITTPYVDHFVILKW